VKRKTRVELTIIFILIAVFLTGLFFLSAKGPELTLDPSDITLEWEIITRHFLPKAVPRMKLIGTGQVLLI